MNASVLHIGVVDTLDRVHAVTFTKGVNVITGRSSTGKSALIEIFDYCFGSSDFTVPVGVITSTATVYFTVLKVADMALVLARKPGGKHAFLRDEGNLELAANAQSFVSSYFEDDYFIPLADFLKALRQRFGIDVTDIDEDLAAREFRRNRQKLSTPSARSLTTFMLQHQGLVANKHAIFYRFDQREKREQAIDHFKIFLGFVDQTYFIKYQELNQLLQEQRRLELAIPKREQVRATAMQHLQDAMAQYRAASGVELGISPPDAVARPRSALDKLQQMPVSPIPESDAHVEYRLAAEREKRQLVADFRKVQQRVADLDASIKFSERYAADGEATVVPEKAELHASVCPFCRSPHPAVETAANDLSEAIDWLNSELARSHYRLESFEEDRRKELAREKELRCRIEECDARIKAVDEQIQGLATYRSQYELAVKALLRVESVLEDLLDNRKSDIEEQLRDLDKKVSSIRAYLRAKYDVAGLLRDGERRVSDLMEEIGTWFEFEASYRPVHLHFSFSDFDLWHETQDGEKVFLRSMGSGANWLSCHVTLFLALHRYFCELGDKCVIPPILFLDQPTQVYFPSVLDTGDDFSPEAISEKDKSRQRPVDADVQAVTNLFAGLVRFCAETGTETGIEPQIIVTDHADHLDLPGATSFDTLVNGRRWRAHGTGLIDRRDTENSNNEAQ